MIDNSSLVLRPWSAEDKSKQELPFLIASLINQRGGFHNVTEESLEEEKRNGELESEEVASENDEEEKSKAEQMQASRAEILQYAQQAFTDSAQALDLVSLLLTKYSPAAESSVSPYIRQNLPMSTLGAEIVESSAISEAKLTNDRLVSTGWKLQALNSAADSMLNSASKLEEEMKTEAKYWDQILNVKEKGWAISRMPNEGHTLGVRFGFLESSPEFRNKSMAALRRNDNGSVKLDFAGDFRTNKVLRARVLYQNITVATSQDIVDKMDDDSLETNILKARNNVFDAELFSELLRESRDLVTHGIRSSKSRISIPLHSDVVLIIEMVNRTANYPTDTPSKHFGKIPQLVLTMLRILLSHSHAAHHRQRTAQPPVIGGKQRTRSSPALLKPILSYLNHRNNQQDLDNQIVQLSTILRNAGVTLEEQSPRSKLDLRKLLASKTFRHPRDFAYSLLASLTSSLETALSYKISISSTPGAVLVATAQHFDFSIHLRTLNIGTEYHIQPGSIALQSTRTLYRETPFQDKTQVIKLAASNITACLGRALAMCSNNRLQPATGESGDLFIKLANHEIRKVELRLDLNKLVLSYTGPEDTEAGEGTVVVRQWTEDPGQSGNIDNLSAAIERITTNALQNASW